MKAVNTLRRAIALAALTWAAVPAQAQNTIKIGELNSYKAQPAFLEPYKKGMELAIDEINAAGGVMGKKFELITRDDNANPGDAVRVAEELISREKIDVLTGTFLSNTGLAVADFAKQKKAFFLAGEPLTDKLTWQGGNAYTFRLRPGTYMQAAMLVPEAVKLKKKRWAVVYPNYEYGQSAVAAFKTLLKAAQPDVEFVAEQAPPLGKLDAGSVVQALADAKPDAIYNVLFGADLSQVCARGQYPRLVPRPRGGQHVDRRTRVPGPAQRRNPQWLVGHRLPLEQRRHQRAQSVFAGLPSQVQRLSAPGLGGGYAMIKSVAAGVAKAQSTDSEKLRVAFRGLQVDTPFGRITYRAEDHQSTMGAFVGRTKNEGGKGVMVDARYLDGAQYQPSAAEVKKSRAAD